MKRCIHCHVEKPFTDFDAAKDGYRAQCKACRRPLRYKQYATAKKYREADPIRAQAKNLTRFWPGSTWQEAWAKYQQLIGKYHGMCWICIEPESVVEPRNGRIKALAVDHCHKTGKVRGALCDRCNRGIGLLRDNVTTCVSAALYLNDCDKDNNGQ